MAEALRLPLILPGPGHGLRELIQTAAQGIGRPVEPIIEIDSYRQIKQLTARGMAFGMLPATAIRQEVEDGQFRSWRIDRPELMRRIHLGYLTGKPLSIASRAVVQLSWTILQGLVQTGTWTATWNKNVTPIFFPESALPK